MWPLKEIRHRGVDKMERYKMRLKPSRWLGKFWNQLLQKHFVFLIWFPENFGHKNKAKKWRWDWATGYVFCRITLWDYFWDAFASVLLLESFKILRRVWLRLWDQFPIRSIPQVWPSVILAGKRDSRRHSTPSFSENVVVAGTNYQM